MSSEVTTDETKSKCEDKFANDNLDLMKIRIPEIPHDIIFPEELNRFLRDRIQHLTLENGMLYKNNKELEADLKERKSEIQKLSNQLVEYKTCINFTGTGNLIPTNISNVATGKIFELSRKLREKTVETESAKTKCTKLEKRIKELESELIKEKTQQIPEKEMPVNEIEEKLKGLTEKLQATNIKLFETKNANVLLKNEMKLANKLLQQEIGDNFTTVQNISQSNWRGRAQQICTLQQKNSDLSEKLKIYSQQAVTVPCSQNNARVEELTNQLHSLKESLQEYKNKLEISKSKRRMLDIEFSSYKTRSISLTEQATRDQQIIDSLTKQLDAAQEMHRITMKQKQNMLVKMENENKTLKIQLERLNCKLIDITRQLEQEKSAKTSEEQEYQSTKYAQEVDQKEVRKIEAEKTRLLELTSILNKRIEEERNQHAETHQNYRVERQKAAKLESKLARLQLEVNTERSSAYNRSKPDEEPEYILRNKLELAQEQILALQTRLQIEQNERKNDVQEFISIIQIHSNTS